MPDRSRLDAWETKHEDAYGKLMARLLRLPVPRPQRQMVTRGL